MSESLQLPEHQKKISLALSSASVSTLVADIFTSSMEASNSVIFQDFNQALENFIPVSLRGLPLHSSGLHDFGSVGGLANVKKTLKETMLWPSKVTNVYHTVFPLGVVQKLSTF